MGASINDVCKIFWFYPSLLPHCHVKKSANFAPFVCFFWDPSPCADQVALILKSWSGEVGENTAVFFILHNLDCILIGCIFNAPPMSLQKNLLLCFSHCIFKTVISLAIYFVPFQWVVRMLTELAENLSARVGSGVSRLRASWWRRHIWKLSRACEWMVFASLNPFKNILLFILAQFCDTFGGKTYCQCASRLYLQRERTSLRHRHLVVTSYLCWD